MKVSLKWLNDYVDLKGISLEEILDKLTYAGLEVEEVVDQAKIFENMVVGFVKEAGKHPNADKLSLCKVSDGKEEFSVVCGAPNVAAGQKVVFAKIGTVIPNGGMKIEKAKIRGEVSFGMLCSERELGISDDHSGLMILDPAFKEGTPITEALGMDDVVIEVAITPNRADALSHIGIARDLSALFNIPLKLPEIELKETLTAAKSFAEIEIQDAENCPRYVGKVVTNVQIKESPEWLKKKLKSIGSRPINNVVDVTNFILYELGQPLHAFDLDMLSGKKIIVRKAGGDKKFITLDSKERNLQPNNLMICDAKIPVAIAGVMGGENSEVTPSTKNILIESAYFNPSSVRKTAKQLSMSTDASYRFERGTDPLNALFAARRAAQLIQETAGGEIALGEIDAYPKELKLKETFIRFKRVEKILGYRVPDTEIEKILVNLGFVVKEKSQDKINVIVPSWRHDIEREIDLIEEVARIYGYNKIPEINKITIALEEKIDQSAFDNKVREVLNSLGFFEIITNSFLSDSVAVKFGKPVTILNPQSSEMSQLRTSLLPGMLYTISKNLKVNEKDLQLYEIGNAFEKISDKAIQSFEDFKETEQLLFAICGNSTRNEWFLADKPFDFSELKGFAQSFLGKLLSGLDLQVKYEKLPKDFMLYSLDIISGDTLLGSGGKLNKEICAFFDVDAEVFVFQINLLVLKKLMLPQRRFTELLKFPKVYRDFAFLVNSETQSDEIVAVIKESCSNLLHNVKLFDIFQSESLGKGKKSLAFQLEFYDVNKTLTEVDIEKDFRNAIKNVEQKFGALLRGS